jgi:hypothetical protein
LIASKGGKYGVYVSFFDTRKLKESEVFTEAIEDYKKQYAKTKYGKEIIEKCATFKHFK